eukprot:TRINITY_DN5923_c0_g1_i3.p1 TRINITY_DN5923_c0_g1~~TRINITY_DN5923_c0_g1_i3.p1  ORF type:complete len:237 (+),score=26.62 TRINITY_DN5923_c0_g1_i3:173-883(+)
MSEQGRIVAEDWYAMVLPVILGYLQSQPQHCGGEEEQARLYSQAAYLCFTVALVALTASGPLPSASKTLQFCLFLLILGCSLLLSLAEPDVLGWAPYFSRIRPLFHLLPAEFQLRILHFSQSVWDNTKQLLTLLSNVPSRFWILQSSESEWNAVAGLVAAGAIPNAQHSSPAQTNLNSLQAVKLCEQQVCSREASTASLASSSSDYHSNLECVLKHLAQLNLEQVHAHPAEEVKPL